MIKGVQNDLKVVQKDQKCQGVVQKIRKIRGGPKKNKRALKK